jgi:hypothetical protein
VGDKNLPLKMKSIMVAHLPPATIITLPGKMIAINSLSGTGSCGGNDFWSPRFKEGGLSAGKAGNYGVEKNLYGMDNKTFSKPLKVRRLSRLFYSPLPM